MKIKVIVANENEDWVFAIIDKGNNVKGLSVF